MGQLPLKIARYVKCYSDLTFGGRPKTLESTLDYCVDRPVLMGQVRSEVLELGKLLQQSPPKRSLEIGTNYGGTLFLLCSVSAPDATIISVDLPSGPFGGGYPKRKAPLFRKFAKSHQNLHLIRGNSHSQEIKDQVLRILNGERLDYLFIDADRTYDGVRNDFEMYSPLVRSGGMVAFHDIVTHAPGSEFEVQKFWDEIKLRYQHREIIEGPRNGELPIAITRANGHCGLGCSVHA